MIWTNPTSWNTDNGWSRSASVAAGTTFDSTSKSTHITLDITKLIATSGVGSTNGTDVFSSVSHSTGKFYAEFTLTTSVAGSCAMGLVNGSFVADAGVFLGGNANGVSCYNDGSYYGASVGFTGGTGTIGTYTSGDVISMAVDIGGGLIWWRKNSGLWFGLPSVAGDPAAGTNGNVISGLGTPVRAAVELAGSGGVWTANFSGGFSFSVPSLYVNW